MEEFDFAVDDCEIIWTSLKLANCKTLYLSSYYRPPNSSPDSLDLLRHPNTGNFFGLLMIIHFLSM